MMHYTCDRCQVTFEGVPTEVHRVPRDAEVFKGLTLGLVPSSAHFENDVFRAAHLCRPCAIQLVLETARAEGIALHLPNGRAWSQLPEVPRA